jgi:hypothetical protein
MQPARGAWGKRELIVWGQSSWVVYQINIKLMYLLKKKNLHQIIELTKNLAPRPWTTSCKEGTSRALADYPWPCCLGQQTAPQW